MNYYIYDNWQAADRESPKIHKWNCGYCHMGFGMHPNANRGEHGVWIGPFDEIEYAWKLIDTIIAQKLSVYEYTKGSTGPQEEEQLVQKHGMRWRS